MENKITKKKSFLNDTFLFSILSVALGLLVGAIALILSGHNPITVYAALIDGIIGKPKYMAWTIIRATPLILTGLSIAFAFKTGLFNIGAEGQFIVGSLVAVLVGFKWEGGIYTLVLACIVGIVTTFSSVAVALIIVAFSKNAKQASSISPIVAVPLSFIAGAFIPLPDCVIATINNQQIQIYEILPWNQAITAIRQVLTYGQGLDAIFMNLIIILIMGIILLAISVLLFNRKISRES